ncbi:GlsB/YeaQ/YmgE family stress response membrane protein [Chloroflexia bacterium SDU3-3]|nr:GlsB/YeaQ/YmgE family stress response membrane protein [Chloroflexia bacterium SDU3-3]
MDLLLEIIMAVTIVGICGAIAEFVVGYSPGQILLVMLVGVVGAYLGNGIAIGLAAFIPSLPSLILIRVGTFTFDLIWTFLGSCLILLVLSLLRGGRRRTIFANGAGE